MQVKLKLKSYAESLSAPAFGFEITYPVCLATIGINDLKAGTYFLRFRLFLLSNITY